MIAIRRILIVVLVSIISYCTATFLHTHPVYAADFAVDYKVDYTIGQDGVTTVDYHIHLVNLSSNVYASDYTLSTGHKNIADVHAFNGENTTLPTKVVTQGDSSNITTTLTNPTYGVGNAYDWTVEYKTKEVAFQKGSLWNVVIPGFIKKDVLRNISINLTVPQSFGPINYISLANMPAKVSQGGNDTYTFSQDQINATGILIVFGSSQNYSFSYSYQLSNTSYSEYQSFTITAPSDIEHQKIFYSQLSMQPNSITKDQDGNYLLTYVLGPRANETIALKGTANVSSAPTDFNANTNPQPLSQEELKLYTSPQKYWEVNNPKILQLAAKITSGQDGVVNKEKAIYDYVVHTLHYDTNQLYIKDRQRMGALKALDNPDKVICQEYVDLFITLSRAAGVPSRMVAGYAQPAVASIQALPPNTLHAWAEFYDDKLGWVDVDPTWESTSGGLDYFGNVGSDHLALARYGASSENPPLVLAFTATQDQSKAMVISTTASAPQSNIDFSILNSKQESNLSGFGGDVSVQVKNTGNRVLFIDSIVTKTTAKLTLQKAQFDPNRPIFPGEVYTIKIPYSSSDFFFNGTKQVDMVVTASADGIVQHKEGSEPILFYPLALLQYIPYIVTFLIFVLSLGLVNGVIRLYRHSAKDT